MFGGLCVAFGGLAPMHPCSRPYLPTAAFLKAWIRPVPRSLR